MPLEWTVTEDTVLLDLIEDVGIEEAGRRLNRPPDAVNMRLAFLRDHEIIHSEEGAMTHRRVVGRNDEGSFVGVLMRDPAPYNSAPGKEIMKKLAREPFISFDRIRSKRAKE